MLLLVAFGFPIVVLGALLGLSSRVELKKRPDVHYPPLDISNLDAFNKNNKEMPTMMLLYSPENELLDDIVKDAAYSLELKNGYASISNASTLEKVLGDGEYFVGIQFDDLLADISSYPQDLEFALRFPINLRTSYQQWSTTNLEEDLHYSGPRNYNQSDGGEPSYLAEGFLAVQHAISMSYLKLAAGTNQQLPEIKMQRFPYPKHIFLKQWSIFNLYLSLSLFLGYEYTLSSILVHIVSEKEKQLKEIMKIMGMTNLLHWTGWFVISFIMLSIISVQMILSIKVIKINGISILNNGSQTLFAFFIICYMIACICFTLMLTTFFSKTEFASVISDLIFFGTFLPYLVMQILGIDMKEGLDSVERWILLHNTAMGFGCRTFLEYEIYGDGLKWSNIFSPISIDDNSTLGINILMMFFSSLIFMLICLYTEQVLPGEFGIPKKWYFPFTEQFWRCGGRNVSLEIGTDDVAVNREKQERNSNNMFEPEPVNMHIGVKVISLRKVFGNKCIVKDITLNMYQNEITVLLGANGAGKSTAISMLIGMLPPSAGTALVNGYDIRTNMDDIRMSLGICPQGNVLFDNMSVANHIVFYCRLKGLQDETAVQEEIDKYLNWLQLEKKANIVSSKLSGGMKRKLSVCCALCAGTKVVFLDEPTTGMDPAARRQLWDLLQQEKLGRTILFTTHLIHEADLLGDRIAIMCDGEMKCYGTSFFLKKKFGSGYRLICLKRENCIVDKVTEFINQYIPNVRPESNIGSELSYWLSDRFIYKFELLLKDLEDKANDFDLDGYGIGITTIEDVFMKIGNARTVGVHDNITSRKNYGSRGASVIVSDIESLQDGQMKSGSILKGLALLRNHCCAMFLKNILYIRRNKFLFMLATIILIIPSGVICSMIGKVEFYQNMPPMTMNLKQYEVGVTVLERHDNIEDDSLESRIADQYRTIATSYGGDYTFEMTAGKQTFSDYILKLGRTMQSRINSRYLTAATIAKGSITAWFNNQQLHTAPLSLNLIHNAIAKALINPSANIVVTNAPLPDGETTKRELQLEQGAVLSYAMVMALSLFMSVAMPVYIIFPIKERQSRAKLLQYVSGVNAWTFWLTHLLFDMLIFTLWSITIIIAMTFWNTLSLSELHYCLILFTSFGVASLSFTYVFSLVFERSSTGYAWATKVNLLAYICFILLCFEEYLDTAESFGIVLNALHILPLFSFAFGILKLSCYSMPCRGLMISNDQWCTDYPMCCDATYLLSWETFGILKELTFLIVTTIFCLLFMVAWDNGIRISLLFKSSRKTQPVWGYDDDVERERQRIAAMSKDELAEENLVVDRLTKCFDKFWAVNQISFCVGAKECFGLLGVNGAGKTETFKMVTGDLVITSGAVYVQGMNLEQQKSKVYKKIGYCPQFCALFDEFTGRETIQIFCLLRGIPKKTIKSVTRYLVRNLSFEQHIDQRIGNYSGGNKRILSTAIAIIGSPSVIYLDEPTSGVGPALKSQIWNLIAKIRDSGRSIVLSSHCMEECEALCTRVAIMVNGEFMCIGSIQYLKKKFSKGLVLKVNLKRSSDLDEMSVSSTTIMTTNMTNVENTVSMQRLQQDINNFNDFILREFPEAVLQEEYRGFLTFYIPLADIQWSKIFGLMERNRDELNVDDYIIYQMRLEDIFLDFAKHQKEKRYKEENH